MHEPPASVSVSQQQQQEQQQQQQQQQTMEGRSLGELPAELFCGGPDPSRIPGLVIEQVRRGASFGTMREGYGLSHGPW